MVFGLDEVTGSNNEYIYKLSSRVIKLFNNTWIYIYPRSRKFVFDNGSEFKLYFTPVLKDYDLKPVYMTLKNPQDNDLVERVHQVIYYMLIHKDIDNKLFDYIQIWGEALAFIAWAIRYYNHRNIGDTPGQAVFVRYMKFNLASVLDWKVITNKKYQQVNIIYNIRKNSRPLIHDYAIGDIVYVNMTEIYHKLGYNKYRVYRITKVF